MDRFALILVGIAFAFALVSYFINHISKGKKSIKYILPSIALVACIYFFYIGITLKSGQGFQDLGNVLMAIMMFAAALAGYITNIVLDFRKKRY